MNKSPEDYFKEQNFTANEAGRQHFTQAEQAFMDKHLGMQGGEFLQKIGIDASSPAPNAAPDAAPGQHGEIKAEQNLDAMLRNSQELLMVGFFIGEQEFILPTVAVQEVIRTRPLAKLPAAPPFVAGVINLRGKVTPLVRLRDMLEVASPRKEEDKFIIVCRRQGIQVGLLIERVHTMYRVPQSDIDWGMEARMGMSADFVSGLLKLNDKLVGIISVDRIIASILT